MRFLKRCGVAVLLFLFMILSASAEQSNQSTKKVKVREGTFVPVKIKARLSSENCQLDQFIDMEAVEDVMVDGAVVIKRGASARAQVDTCQKAGIGGVGGNLRLVIHSIKAVDDQNVPLRTTASRIGEDKTMQAMGGALICPFLALQKGEPTEYAAGAEFKAFTTGDKEIEVK